MVLGANRRVGGRQALPLLWHITGHHFGGAGRGDDAARNREDASEEGAGVCLGLILLWNFEEGISPERGTKA